MHSLCEELTWDAVQRATTWLIARLREHAEWPSPEIILAAEAAHINYRALFEARLLLSLPTVRPCYPTYSADSLAWIWWVPENWSPPSWIWWGPKHSLPLPS